MQISVIKSEVFFFFFLMNRGPYVNEIQLAWDFSKREYNEYELI